MNKRWPAISSSLFARLRSFTSSRLNISLNWTASTFRASIFPRPAIDNNSQIRSASRYLGPGDLLLILATLLVIGYFTGSLAWLWPHSDGSWQLQRTTQTTLVKALRQLPVSDTDHLPAHIRHYRREFFGPAWSDVDGNGCDTRNDILLRDLKEPVTREDNSCQVQSGLLQDPYTGAAITFYRGPQTSITVQIDHVVALGNAWRSGAFKLSAEQREFFANDPLNLLAVSGPANQEKSDQDASTWLPSNQQYHCAYAARQIAVKTKYSLAVSRSEKRALAQIIVTCPKQELPEH